MGGESREGWAPFIRRQWDSLTSVPSTPLPSTLDTSGLRAPRTWQDLGTNINKSLGGVGDLVSHPLDTITNFGKKWYENNKSKFVDTGEDVLGRVGAVTTAPVAKAAGAMMDVADPRNSGSEKKPISDVAWEAAKAVKSGLLNPKKEQPTFTDEVGSRLPTEFGQGGDPLSQAYGKFALNTGADLSNFLPAHAVAGAAGGLAHLAGMAGAGAKEAAIPMWLAKKQQNISHFTHGTPVEADIKSMIENGFRPKMGGDVLERYMHVAALSPEQVETARRAGKQPLAKIAGPFGDYQMPVDIPDNALALNLFEPVPKEDIQDIVDKLHPVHDKAKIDSIWRAWDKQKHLVVDPADQISGKVPFKSIENSLDKSRLVRDLERELAEGKVYGINGKGGHAPLNHPDMPTAANSRWGTTFYHDTVAGDAPSLAVDPNVANVRYPSEKTPWKPLGVHKDVTFPRDVGTQATIKEGLWAPVDDFDTLNDMKNHVNDIKTHLQDYKVNVDPSSPLGHFLASSPEEQAKTSPSTAHKLTSNYLHQNGYSTAGHELEDLWETKVLSNEKTADAAENFHWDIVNTPSISPQDKAAEWHALPPEVQQAYKSAWPTEYNKNIKTPTQVTSTSGPKKSKLPAYSYTVEAEGKANDFYHNHWMSKNYSVDDAAKHFTTLDPEVQEAFKTMNPGSYSALIDTPGYKNAVAAPAAPAHYSEYQKLAYNALIKSGKSPEEAIKFLEPAKAATSAFDPKAFNDKHFGGFNVSLTDAAKDFQKLTGPERGAFMAAYPDHHQQIIKSKSWAALHSAPPTTSLPKVVKGPKTQAQVQQDLANYKSLSPKQKNEYSNLMQAGTHTEEEAYQEALGNKKVASSTPNDGWGNIGKTKSGKDWKKTYPNVDQQYIESIADTIKKSAYDQEAFADVFANDLEGPDSHALKQEYPELWQKLYDAHEAEHGPSVASPKIETPPGPVEAPKPHKTLTETTAQLTKTWHDLLGNDSKKTLQEKIDFWAKIPEDTKKIYRQYLPDEVGKLEAGVVEPPKSTTGIPYQHQAEYDRLKATLKDDLAKTHFHGLVAQGGYSPAEALKEIPKYTSTETVGPSAWADKITKFKSEHPEIAEKFSGHTGTEMGSIESHTKDVMHQWETQLSKDELKGISTKFGTDVDSVLQDALYLHDIGKADAIKAGSKLDQHKHTIPIMRETLQKRGYSEKQIDLVTELFNHDLLGSAVQGLSHGKPEQLGQAMTDKAKKVGMPVKDFVKLQMAVYQADASSYPFVTKFMKKDPSGKWTFSGHKNLKQVDALLEAK